MQTCKLRNGNLNQIPTQSLASRNATQPTSMQLCAYASIRKIKLYACSWADHERYYSLLHSQSSLKEGNIIQSTNKNHGERIPPLSFPINYDTQIRTWKSTSWLAASVTLCFSIWQDPEESTRCISITVHCRTVVICALNRTTSYVLLGGL